MLLDTFRIGHRKRLCLVITLLLLLASSLIFAQDANGVQDDLWVKVGLVAGVGKQEQIDLTNTALKLYTVQAPDSPLLTLGADNYTVKTFAVSSWQSNESFPTWDDVPEALRAGSVPLVDGEGLKLLWLSAPDSQLLNQHNVQAVASGTPKAVGLYAPKGLVAVVASELGAISSEAIALQVGQYAYRGLIVFKNEVDGILPINYLDLESYLYGVVPKEMSPSWPIEAIKAQAVAARTYAIQGMGRFKTKGYDHTDDTMSQVYRGFSIEDPRSNAAVDATRGLSAMYQGKRIEALFHSNSGGYTESSENVFVSALPYLRGKEDPYSVGAPTDLWTISYTPDQIQSILKQKGHDIGTVQGVISRSSSPSGRVTALEIQGTKKSVVLEKEQVRSVFGATTIKSLLFKVSKGDKMSVLSSNGLETLVGNTFVVRGANEVVTLNSAILATGSVLDFKNNSNSDENVYQFSGRGYGHGVGMSQYGAKGMAEIGMDYVTILKFYYSGIDIE